MSDFLLTFAVASQNLRSSYTILYSEFK